MEKSNMNGEAVMASQKGMLVVESFLQENYIFRFNVLNGKVEFVTKSAVNDVIADNDSAWRPLTDRALKSIIIRAKREDVCETSRFPTPFHKGDSREDGRLGGQSKMQQSYK